MMTSRMPLFARSFCAIFTIDGLSAGIRWSITIGGVDPPRRLRYRSAIRAAAATGTAGVGAGPAADGEGVEEGAACFRRQMNYLKETRRRARPRIGEGCRP